MALASSSAAIAQQITARSSPGCGCCHLWAQSLERAGFHVSMTEAGDLGAITNAHGVKPQFASCHTAMVEGYVIEGHVPAQEIKRLLSERPDAIGLSAPGMPQGAPGMEFGAAQPYQILVLKKDGTTQVFAQYP